MLTFLVAWPAFHICAGQRILFALTIMGDPQLLFRTLEEPLNASSSVVCSAAPKGASGEAALECISMKLWTR